jgi:hypothetical protein
MQIIVTTLHSFSPSGINYSFLGASLVLPQLEVTLEIVACISAVRRTFLELPQSWSDICNKLYNGTYNVYNSTRDRWSSW